MGWVIRSHKCDCRELVPEHERPPQRLVVRHAGQLLTIAKREQQVKGTSLDNCGGYPEIQITDLKAEQVERVQE
jgi:hypothetical protein